MPEEHDPVGPGERNLLLVGLAAVGGAAAVGMVVGALLGGSGLAGLLLGAGIGILVSVAVLSAVVIRSL